MYIERIGRLLCLLAAAIAANAGTTEYIRLNGRVLARVTSFSIDGGPAVMSLGAGECSTVPFPATAGTNVTISASGTIPASIAVYKPDSDVLGAAFSVGAAADDAPDRTYDIRLLNTGMYRVQACSLAASSGTLKIALARSPVDRFDIRLEMTQEPLRSGTDVSATRYRVRNLGAAQRGIVERAAIQAKTPPAGGPVTLGIWVSHDNGANWQPILSNWELASGSTAAETTSAFLTTELRRDDLLRYDVNTAGATTPGNGIEVTLTVGVIE